MGKQLIGPYVYRLKPDHTVCNTERDITIQHAKGVLVRKVASHTQRKIWIIRL